MSKIVVVGDSFFVRVREDWAWTSILHMNKTVHNLAQSGASNAHIWLWAREQLIGLGPEDRLIIGWSDRRRVWSQYRLSDRTAQAKMRDLYHRHFSHNELDKVRDQAMQREIVEECQRRSVPLLWMWSFPWGYRQAQKGDWTSPDQGQSPEDSVYTDWAAAQIRPALFDYSKREIPGATSQERIRAMQNDSRPNHLADQDLHRRIAQAVISWIDHPSQGILDLETVK